MIAVNILRGFFSQNPTIEGDENSFFCGIRMKCYLKHCIKVCSWTNIISFKKCLVVVFLRMYLYSDWSSKVVINGVVTLIEPTERRTPTAVLLLKLQLSDSFDKTKLHDHENTTETFDNSKVRKEVSKEDQGPQKKWRKLCYTPLLLTKPKIIRKDCEDIDQDVENKNEFLRTLQKIETKG